jgi:hypothetical protein
MLLDERSYPIQQVLEKHLEPKNLAFAMRLWSTNYINQPSISLQRFVDDFYSRQTMSTSSYGLYSDLLPAMMSSLQARSRFTGELMNAYELPDYDLGGKLQEMPPPLPVNVPATQQQVEPMPITIEKPAIEATSIAIEPEAPKKPPERPKDERFVIFSSFIRQLLNGVNPERREKMIYRNRDELKETCKPEAAEPLYAWIQTDSDYFQHNLIGIDEMTAITHVIYTGLCEYQGPVDADRILMKVAGKINDTYPFASLDINQLL